MKKKIIVVALILFLSAGSLFAYQPFLYSIVLDASSSVSTTDFKKANEAAAALVAALYKRSQLHPGELAEFVSVNWFGGEREYVGTPFYNASHQSRVAELLKYLLYLRHPQFGSTAVYTSAIRAAYGLQEAEKQLGRQYPKIILLITDGSDTGSSEQMKNAFRQVFPAQGFVLVIIGVGPSAGVSVYQSDANMVTSIDNFGELGAVLLAISEKLE